MRELGLATAKPVSTPSTTENVETLDEVSAQYCKIRRNSDRWAPE